MAVLLLSATVTPTGLLRSRPKTSQFGKGFGSSRVSLRSSQLSTRVSLRVGSIRCQAFGEGSQNSFDRTVYQGTYGPWTVDPSDVREVLLYRSGLVTAATSFVIAASTAFLPDNTFIKAVIDSDLNLLYALGAGGLGLSLFLIHIYVTEIKRTLQALWAIGALGSLATYLSFALPLDKSLPEYVIENPTVVWFVGPLFAALTGLVFKEGLCYGKLEAIVLTFTIPTILLGHLNTLRHLRSYKVTPQGVMGSVEHGHQFHALFCTLWPLPTNEFLSGRS